MTGNVRIDRIMGRWAVQAELGRGSMGRVLLLEDALPGASAGRVPVACKVLDRPELRSDFINEFMVLRRLAHPGFVTPLRLVYAPEVPTGEIVLRPRLYAFMERAVGDTLQPARGHDGAFALLARDLLLALEHLHRSGLVHGDLAPDNVLWCARSERLTVLDLGAGGERGARAGKTSGVLAYAAPERLEGAALEPAGDLWSVGALLFGVVHGRHPWPGYPAVRAPLPDRTGCAPHVLDAFLDRLLAWDPSARHPNASAALAELESLLPEVIKAPATFVAPALIDAHGRLASAAEDLTRAAREQRATSLDLRGAAESGRTRALTDLLERLAMGGVPGLEIPVREDDERVWLGDVLTALGMPNEEPRIASLVRAIAATGGPIVLAVDDLERSPNVRQMLERLVRALETIPDHYRGLMLLTVGLDAGPRLEMARWGADEAHEAMRLRFPKRRFAGRDADALITAARGSPGLFRAIVEEALRAGILRVDSSQIVCDSERLLAMVPPSHEAKASEALARLPERVQEAAAVLAWATLPVPLPDHDAAGALSAGALDGLLASGLAVREAKGVRVASEAVAQAAQPGIAKDVAGRMLAATYAACGESALALAHRLQIGEDVAHEAETLLLSGTPSLAQGVPLAKALAARPEWPTTARVALAVAQLLEAWGEESIAAALFSRAEVLARVSHERALTAQALLGTGRSEAAAARYPRALEAFRTAAMEAGTIGEAENDARDPLLMIEIRAGEARAAVLSGDLEAAEKAAEDGLARIERAPRRQAATQQLAALLYSRALVDWYRGQLDVAETRLDKALLAAREAKAGGGLAARKEEAAIVTAQGLVAHRRGDLTKAARAYGEAMRLGEAANDQARVLTALQNLGVLQHERGEWTEALDTYREALARAEQLDARARIAQIAGNLGNLWRYLGETERAEMVLQRSQAIARADDNRHLCAVVANLLGDVASDRGDLVQAEARFREAIEIAEEAQCKPEELEASLNLARLLLERFELKASRELAERARTMAEAAGNHAMRTTALAILAALARISHDADGAGGADGKALIEEAIAQVESHKNADGRWPIYLEAALAARDREDLAAAQSWSKEVRKVLQAQLDSVPAAQREAFKARRDRRDAYRETAAFVLRPGEAGPTQAGVGLGWGRLLEVHKRLAGEHNVQRLLEYIMDSAILLTGAERGFLLLDDESHKEGLEVRIARNLDQENIRNKHLKISRGIARRVIAAGEPIVTVDAMEDERYKEQLSVVDLRLRSIMCLPMAFRGRVLGAIYLDNRFRASAFAGEDLRFMEAFADMAAVALDNARLVETLEAEKRKTEAARKEVESLNQRLEADLERRTRELEDTKVQMIAERRQLATEQRFDNMIGSAPAMRRTFQMIDRLRNADVAVLIEGESGTGKELVARAIHFSGQRRDRPFVAVNCGAIPAMLLESELFGHVRGAFTNATSDKKGLFEVAHTGTLFLDEIGEMPLEMQVKLLRVLQCGEIQKVGATRQVTVDVRIVAATNRKLEEEVGAGRFREDLFYRLSVVPLVVPPLRDRREDIPLLVQHFIEANRKSGLGQVQSISKDALALLGRYGWPGNVRQLETVLKNASVFADTPVLGPRDFESFPDIVGMSGAPAAGAVNDKGMLQLQGRTLAELERFAIVQSLKDNKGNKKKTAELLGIDRRTLYNKLAAYGIAIESDLKVS